MGQAPVHEAHSLHCKELLEPHSHADAHQSLPSGKHAGVNLLTKTRSLPFLTPV